MRTALTTVENRRREGLYGNNLYVGILLLEVFGNTADGPSCAYTGNEDIYLSIGVLPDLRTGCGIVACWIGTVFKLLAESEMQKEWEETEAKLGTMRAVIIK